MSGLSKSETETLARSLELQGCRLERPSSSGGYPIRVFFPNGDTTVLHGSVTDRMAVTIKRTEVRRAGLTWPFDDKRATKRLHKVLRQEQGTMSMSTAMKDPTSREELNRNGHVRFPAGARDYAAPLESSAAPVLAALEEMPETFWTDDLRRVLADRSVPGYRGTNQGMGRLQGMLDFLGYRVIEAKPNRNGFSYRWEKVPGFQREPFADPTERARRASQARTAPVTPIKTPKLPTPPKVPVPTLGYAEAPPSPTAERRQAIHEGREPEEVTVSAPTIVIEGPHPDTSAAKAEVEAALAMAEQAEQEATRLKEVVERQRELLERRDARIAELQNELLSRPAGEPADVWPVKWDDLAASPSITIATYGDMLKAMGLEAMLRRVA